MSLMFSISAFISCFFKLSPLDSTQLVSVLPGHQQTSSPRTLHRTRHSLTTREDDAWASNTAECRRRFSRLSHVHMEPHVVLLADVCDFIDGVKGTVDGGAGGGIHIHGNVTLQ